MTIVVRELTARAPGAVAVLELAGPGARATAAALAGRDVPLGVPVLARLRFGADLVDEALVAARAEDAVELHLHGSLPLVRRVLAALAQRPDLVGAEELGRPAAAGRERLEDHARRVAAAAPSVDGARIALDQADGALRAELEALHVLDAQERIRRIRALVERARVARFALAPARVVLAGPVNAGKSTLFNVLLGHARAITSEQSGTTRDVLTEPARFGAWPVLLSDTAGERADPGADPAAELERRGQALARRVAEAADLVLWLEPAGCRAVGRALDGGGPCAPSDGTAGSIVASIASRSAGMREVREPAVAALEDPVGARATVAAVFRAAFELPARAWVPGAAVPVDPELARVLAGLADQVDPARIRAALDPFLATS